MKDIPKRVFLKKLLRNAKLVWKVIEGRIMAEGNRPRSTIPTVTSVAVHVKLLKVIKINGEIKKESKDYASIIITSENGVDMIRSSYSLIKQRLHGKLGKLEDYMFHEVLSFDDFFLAMKDPIESEQIDILLTIVLRKGNVECEKFIQILKKQNILSSDELQDFQTKTLPCDGAEFSNVHADIFSYQSLRNFLRDELEINLIIDDMFEWHLIEIDTHVNFRRATERVQKVDALLTEMDKVKNNEWFVRFCCILTKHVENIFVIEKIRQQASRSQISETAKDDDVDVTIGNTLKITTANLTEERLRQLHIDDMNGQLQRQHHIVDVRDGCVEFILFNSTNKLSQDDCLEFIRKVIEMEDVKSTLRPGQTFNVAVRVYDENIPLLDDDGERLLTFPIKLALKLSRMDLLKNIDNVAATFELLEDEARVNKETRQKLSSKDVEIQKQYILYALSNCSDDELQTVLQKSKDLEKCKVIYDCVQRWKCLNCYRQSILNEKQRVLNEIDTAIMKQTLDGQHQLPKCLYEYCVEKAKSISRSERAKCFLHFILIKGSCLVAFAEVIATRTKLCIQHAQCRTCTGATPEEESEEKLTKEVYNFVINDTGVLIPVETNQEQASPAHYLVKTDTKAYGKQALKRQQSTNEFIELPIDRIDKLEGFLSQTEERPRKVKVLSGEEVLKSKQLQEHRGDKFVLIFLKEM